MNLSDYADLIKDPSTSAGIVWRAIVEAGVETPVETRSLLQHLVTGRSRRHTVLHRMSGAIGGINSELKRRKITDYRIVSIPGTDSIMLTNRKPFSPKLEEFLERVAKLDPALAQTGRREMERLLYPPRESG